MGKNLIIINKQRTKMEGKADLVFHDRIDDILGRIILPDQQPQAKGDVYNNVSNHTR